MRERFCYWSVADGVYADMFAACVRSAHAVGVFQDFHLRASRCGTDILLVGLELLGVLPTPRPGVYRGGADCLRGAPALRQSVRAHAAGDERGMGFGLDGAICRAVAGRDTVGV